MLRAQLIHRLWSTLIAAILVAVISAGARAQDAVDINAVNKQVQQLQFAHKYSEATPIAEQTLALAERTLGPEHPDTLSSVENLASIYFEQGRIAESEPLYRRVLEARERVLGPEHPDTLVSVNDLGHFHQGLGQYSEAERLMQRGLQARERVLGPEHYDTIESVSSLAALYAVVSRHAEAEVLFKRALAVRERVLGLEHPDTLFSLDSLAAFYRARGRYDEAEPLLRRGIETSGRVLGLEHPDTLLSVNRLGELLLIRGRYSEAKPLILRALEGRDRALGKEHPDTLTSVNNLAVLYKEQGRYADAEALYKRAVEASERVRGAEHPDTLGRLNNLAALYKEQARYGEAEPLLKRCLEATERVLGAEHPQSLLGMNNLATLYIDQGRYNEAAPLFIRALEAQERVLGRENSDTLITVGNLAQLYRAQGRYAEAEPLHERALEASERLLGMDHPDTIGNVNNLASLYRDQGRYSKAEPLFDRALATYERVLGSEHPNTLVGVSNLAGLYLDKGRYSDAEPLFLRALEARQRVLSVEHPDTLISINNLATLYATQGRDAEAESLLKRPLEASERELGPDHPRTLSILSNLAALYRGQGRYGEAEPLYARVLRVRERVLGMEHPDTLASVSRLGELFSSQRRYGEAERLILRALNASERILGKEHPDTLQYVDNLAGLYLAQARYDEAEALYKRGLEARERVLGPEHPSTLQSLGNLAFLYPFQNRGAEAERLYERALDVSGRVLGRDHPNTLGFLNGLAMLQFVQSDWGGATQSWRRDTAAIAQRTQRGAIGTVLTGSQKSEAEQSSFEFRGLIKALHSLASKNNAPDMAASHETFQAAQWALSSEAARSLAQMAARGARGDPELAAFARERQDLLAEWRRRDGLRNAALGETQEKRIAKAEAENRDRLAAIDTRITEIDQRLAADFPDYAALASPSPSSVEEAQAQLGADEALLLFLDLPEFGPTPEETFIWVVTKTELRWARSDRGTAALTRDVQALRCGLDDEEWATPTYARRCGDLLGRAQVPDASGPLPFDLGKAHELYKALFGQIEDMIAGKRLLIVPSGALTSLPFHVLVTKAPAVALPERYEGYRNAAWLGRANAITTLPAVSSLKALREHASSGQAASDDYIGFGNPLLSGDGSSCRVTKSPATCPLIDAAAKRTASSQSEPASIRERGGRRSANATTDEIFAKGSTPRALLEQVRGLCPLSDTAYEIQCVAQRFKEKTRLIRLAGEARETDIKALSESGQLARFRILHFATHGLLSGDVEKMAQRQGEPALVLTPPDASDDAEDDGLLMASEVAALKLNADWVVLSACNTAAGDQIGAQALSGLARAFFYAGGRALLVSHWPVYSDAAVRLTTGAFGELERKPKAGRAEALQRAMIDLMDDASQADNAHPAVWAPFVVVGEGGS